MEKYQANTRMRQRHHEISQDWGISRQLLKSATAIVLIVALVAVGIPPHIAPDSTESLLTTQEASADALNTVACAGSVWGFHAKTVRQLAKVVLRAEQSVRKAIAVIAGVRTCWDGARWVLGATKTAYQKHYRVMREFRVYQIQMHS